MTKLTHDEFLERLRERNSHYAADEFEVLGEYAGISAPLRCRCLVCGKVWDGNPDSMLRRNSRCPKCGRAAAGKSSGKSRTLTHEAFVGRAANACSDIEIIGRYADGQHEAGRPLPYLRLFLGCLPRDSAAFLLLPLLYQPRRGGRGQRPRYHASGDRGGVGLRTQRGAETHRRRGGFLQKDLVAMPRGT